MPRPDSPTVRVLVLEGFIARPGHAARPGETIEVPPHVANTAIALGKARLPTQEDEARVRPVDTRDPVPAHRDPPPPSRRKR